MFVFVCVLFVCGLFVCLFAVTFVWLSCLNICCLLACLRSVCSFVHCYVPMLLFFCVIVVCLGLCGRVCVDCS